MNNGCVCLVNGSRTSKGVSWVISVPAARTVRILNYGSKIALCPRSSRYCAAGCMSAGRTGRISARTGQDCSRCGVFHDELLAWGPPLSAVRDCYPRSHLFNSQPEQATLAMGSVKTVMRILFVRTVGSSWAPEWLSLWKGLLLRGISEVTGNESKNGRWESAVDS